MSVKWNGIQTMARVRRGALRGIAAGIGIVEQRAVYLITQEKKSGRIYTTKFFTIGSGPTRVIREYGRRPAHQASAPGEPPASDTGALVNSRTVEIDATGLRGRLTFRSKHAIYMEFGTDRIAPRPFARRALVDTKGEVYSTIEGAIRAELKKGQS